LQAWELPGMLACHATALGDGLLTPFQLGQVFWMDPRSGRELARPFQPALESGVLLPWRLPLTAAEQEIVVSDGRRRVFRVGLKETPEPHLDVLAQADLRDPIVSPIATVESVAYAVDASGHLQAFSDPTIFAFSGHRQVDQSGSGPSC
jgi:hypothetical protein